MHNNQPDHIRPIDEPHVLVIALSMPIGLVGLFRAGRRLRCGLLERLARAFVSRLRGGVSNRAAASEEQHMPKRKNGKRAIDHGCVLRLAGVTAMMF